MSIERLNSDSTSAWDSFVTEHPDGTFFHLSGWATVLTEAFSHTAHYLYHRSDDGTITGILPLGEVRSWLFGHSLASTPFCVYGGVLATTPEAEAALLTAASKLAEDLKVDFLELRNRQPVDSPISKDWPTKDLHVTFRKSIEADNEANMMAIPRKQRAMVRKGIKAGLQSEYDSDNQRFFDAYSQSVRNLGTPVFPKPYFDILRRVFADQCDVLTITHEGELVASVMSFYFRDEVLPYYGGGTLMARKLKGNDFMYWELMRRSADRGIRLFDFGRSKQGAGSYSFKKNWGFEPVPMHYQYHLVRSTDIPDINPNNPKYRLFINGWKKLPLPVSRLLGPYLAKNLG